MTKFNLCILALVLSLYVQVSLQAYTTAAEGLPAEVVAHVSARMERLHHNLFHNVRMAWYLLGIEEQRAIAKAGWEPPRPAKAYKKTGEILNLEGTAGEDFIYMHRRMIEKVNAAAATGTSGWTVDGWTAAPAPGDASWPVPAAYNFPTDAWWTSEIARYKSDDFYTTVIVPEEAWLANTTNLQSLTLGQLGTRLEFGMHDWFHTRFSTTTPIGFRIQSAHPTEYIDPKWDVSSYNYLGDFYSAHCSVYFWKIHGWIEMIVTNWMTANSITKIQWAGSWEGGPMGTMGTGIDTDIVQELSQIAEDAKHSTATSSTNITAVVLGCVLGGLALILIFALIVVYMVKVVPANKAALYQGKAKKTEVAESYAIVHKQTQP